MFESTIRFVRDHYRTDGPVPLHAPVFAGREKELLGECIDSTYVSSVGPFVETFEKSIAAYLGSRYAVAVVNGTQALFTALKLAGASPETEVLTQSLTFAATANAIAYTGASPVFVDVDRSTLGMSPQSLGEFLETRGELRNGQTFNRSTGRRIASCVPMHTLGQPCRIDQIVEICDRWGIALIEDAAESLGSRYRGRHTGTFGAMGIFSFNGNKIITTGGGGMLVTDDEHLARRARHLITTAKQPHPWEFVHDELGYNFRMPNLNAALGLAQIELLPAFMEKKRHLAEKYSHFFDQIGVEFVREPVDSLSNYWLNSILLKDRQERDAFLEYTNSCGIMTRPLWRPMHLLAMYSQCEHSPLDNTEALYDRVVSLPSSVHL